jgi:hypothetical protein
LHRGIFDRPSAIAIAADGSDDFLIGSATSTANSFSGLKELSAAVTLRHSTGKSGEREASEGGGASGFDSVARVTTCSFACVFSSTWIAAPMKSSEAA